MEIFFCFRGMEEKTMVIGECGQFFLWVCFNVFLFREMVFINYIWIKLMIKIERTLFLWKFDE